LSLDTEETIDMATVVAFPTGRKRNNPMRSSGVTDSWVW
jgi:hypothetical protein